jgi:hypothetical protein
MNSYVLTGLSFLSAEGKRDLVDAMLNIQVMRWPQERQQILDEITQNNPDFQPERSAVDHIEVLNFIEACRNDEESFDLLLDAIEMRAGEGDMSLEMLHEVVLAMLPRSGLLKSELRDLLALEPDSVITGAGLTPGLRLTWPEWSASHVSGGARPKDVREAVLLLLNASDAGAGLRRVLRFAGWLAEFAAVMGDAGLRKSLAAWTRSIATRNDIDPASCRPPARAAADDTPVLLVELLPATPEQFTVRLWLATGDSEYRPLDWDTELCRLDDLRARLDEVIGFASRELGDAGAESAPAVEFRLNVDNIDQAVDWWDIDSSSILPRPLGVVYKVVVRRQRDNDTERHNWRIRWKAVKDAPVPAKQLAVWLDDPAANVKNFWNQLSAHDRILIAPLDGDMRRLVSFAFDLGLPVALCVRGDQAAAIAQLPAIASGLGNRSMHDLPALVQEWRLAAFMHNGKHFGSDLVLLWDDYERQPPGAAGKLRPPAMKGAS